MSKFNTHILINVKAVEDALPKGSHINGVHLAPDHKSVVVEWENDNFKTPFTMAVELTPAALAGEEPMPECVKNVAECKRVQNEEVAPKQTAAAQKKPSAPKPPKAPKVKTTNAPNNSQPPTKSGNQAGS